MNDNDVFIFSSSELMMAIKLLLKYEIKKKKKINEFYIFGKWTEEEEKAKLKFYLDFWFKIHRE